MSVYCKINLNLIKTIESPSSETWSIFSDRSFNYSFLMHGRSIIVVLSYNSKLTVTPWDQRNFTIAIWCCKTAAIVIFQPSFFITHTIWRRRRGGSKSAKIFETIVFLTDHFYPSIRGQDHHHCYQGLLGSIFDPNLANFCLISHFLKVKLTKFWQKNTISEYLYEPWRCLWEVCCTAINHVKTKKIEKHCELFF